MNSRRYFTGSFLLLISLIVSCAPALYIPTLADAQIAGVTTESLVTGRKVYVDNCSNCHSLYRPEHFTKNEWAKVMPVMQKKAKIDNEQRKMIVKYLSVHYKDGE